MEPIGYKSDKNNIATITINEAGVKMDMAYVEKDARMYGIRKEWKNKVIDQ